MQSSSGSQEFQYPKNCTALTDEKMPQVKFLGATSAFSYMYAPPLPFESTFDLSSPECEDFLDFGFMGEAE